MQHLTLNIFTQSEQCPTANALFYHHSVFTYHYTQRKLYWTSWGMSNVALSHKVWAGSLYSFNNEGCSLITLTIRILW